jgi:hypothetical protein
LNALVADYEERRRLAADFLSWRIDRLGVRRKRPATSDIPGVWSWDQLTNRAPAPPPATSHAPQARPPCRISHTMPQPMTGWKTV